VEHSETLHDLHRRYVLQTKWTVENRRRLYDAANLQNASRVLDVGAGTGAISHELPQLSSATAHAVDIDPDAVSFAHEIDANTNYIIADAVKLPYPKGSFDITLCHFLLMWVTQPLTVLKEMKRVTKSQGVILALAEPDYGGRIDYPEELVSLGQLQAEALESQGADTHMGRKLRMLFAEAGLHNIHVGVLGGQWQGMPDEATLISERNTLTKDIQDRVSTEELDEFFLINQKAWQSGHRLLYVPTFYAFGRNPA
jgi:SAM-dependent methyltransferase